MYNVIDNTKYYLHDFQFDYYIKFDNEEKLIEEIAKGFFYVHSVFDWDLTEKEKEKKKNNSSRWKNIYFDGLTLEDTNYFLMSEMRQYININLINEVAFYKRFLFFDSRGCLVDVRKYKEQAIKLCIQNKWLNTSRFSWNGRHVLNKKRKKKSWRSGNYHGGRTHRTSYHSSVQKTIKQNHDPEHKEFVRRRDKEMERYGLWHRDISCSWKDQTKDRKQWMHNQGKIR